MKEMSVEQLEWLISLAEDRAREMVESPEKTMLKQTVTLLNEARLEAKNKEA